VDIGYFNGEGHSQSELTLASIATLLEKGSVDGDQPARFVMETVAADNLPQKSGEVIQAVRRYLASLDRVDLSEQLLDSIGAFYRDEYKNLLGDSSRLTSNAPSVIERKGRDEPGIDTGELRDNAGFRTSKSGAVQK
tara:strand:- start:34419 stop:34829 length:411 start_codon:yes stop_codon:yes gene_type:complete